MQKVITKRLILREPTKSDAISLVAFSNSKEIAKWLSSHPYPFTIDDANSWINRATSKEYRGFLITLKDTKEPIGVINIDISISHNHSTLSYYLAKEHQNRGYMSEALKGVVDFCFNNLNLIRVAAHHFSGNSASKEVLRKAGFILEGVRKKHFKRGDKYLDIYDYGLINRDYFKKEGE